MDFSIDVGAAIRKLVEKQQLNQVHYAIQLLRQALERRPKSIHIHTSGSFFEIRHDGQPPGAEEMQAFHCVLGSEDEAAFQALKHLEDAKLLPLLFPLMQFAEVSWHTASYVLEKSSAELTLRSDAPLSPESCLRFSRPAALRRREREELLFFCRRPSCAVWLDGKQLTARPPLAGQNLLLEGEGRTSEGVAHFGLGSQGELSEIHYLKHGVLFGTRSWRSGQGLPMVVEWDSSYSDPERDFERSIQAGDCHLAHWQSTLEEALLRHFAELPKKGRQALRIRILGLEPAQVPSSLHDLPLFASSEGVAWSLARLRKLEEELGWLPFFFAANHVRASRPLPLLHAQELGFLRRMGLHPVRFLPAMQSRGYALADWLGVCLAHRADEG
jgi:hypothetical protein